MTYLRHRPADLWYNPRQDPPPGFRLQYVTRTEATLRLFSIRKATRHAKGWAFLGCSGVGYRYDFPKYTLFRTFYCSFGLLRSPPKAKFKFYWLSLSRSGAAVVEHSEPRRIWEP